MHFLKLPQIVLLYWVAFSWPLWCHGEVLHIRLSYCLNASAAVWVSGQASRSIQDCYWLSREPIAMQTSIGLVQFNSMSKSCAVYRFKDVCHQLNLTAVQQQSVMTGETCKTLIDLAYDLLTANTYFAAVWLGGYGPALENIVCGPAGVRNPVTASNIVWTSSGAQMNGMNSSLLVKDSTGFNFSSGFSMLVELRRKVGFSYCFMEMTDCTNFTDINARLWEWPTLGQLYFVNPHIVETPPYMLTRLSAEFFKVAVSYEKATNRSRIFIDTAALPDEFVKRLPITTNSVPGINCVKIGYRDTGFGSLNGVVKMAAIANSNLPDDVMLRFLSGN